MSKKRWYRGILMTFILVMLLGTNAMAKESDPLKNVPKRYGWIVSGYKWNGSYQYDSVAVIESSKNAKLQVASSNKNVADAEVVTVWKSKKKSGKWVSYKYTGFQVKRAGYGETDITVTLEMNGKKYTKIMKYTVSKYENPFASIKIGGKNITSQLNKSPNKTKWYDNTYKYLRVKGVKAGKLNYKLKKGYKILQMTISTSQGKGLEVKNNKTLPKDWSALVIVFQNKKTGAVGELLVDKK